MTTSLKILLFYSKINLFKLVPKYGSPKKEFLVECNINVKFYDVAAWPVIVFVEELLNISGNFKDVIMLSNFYLHFSL